MTSHQFRILDSGGIEIRVTDSDGQTRGYRLKHDSQDRLVLGHQPAGSDTWQELVPEQASGTLPTK